ncbi:male-specific lethal 3 homolog [Bacillus rossius redtenbacheri]|uniref:male-specific lethal 3 homolog n=1 Tax=Bacillus rossius redtenbacheri TaxID=93214 RepID=UPI002FDD081F
MVSTRGMKFKFTEGERVLCYEPDPTKAKVLYDSKVLEVIAGKDNRGKKNIEYLIHFQGWNSSWDRCVSEDYVLKDTDENRQLQKHLADKAQLQFGAYLYRRERKKNLPNKVSESLEQNQKRVRRRRARQVAGGGGGAASSEEEEEDRGVSSGSQSQHEDSDGAMEREPEGGEGEEVCDGGSSSGGETSADDDRVILDLSETIRRLLEQDYELVTKKNKLVRLPANPTVVNILEGYVKHCAINQLGGFAEKTERRNRHSHPNKTKDVDQVCRSLNLWKEIVDGVRIYFDVTLGELLLYNQERQQFSSVHNLHPLRTNVKEEVDESAKLSVKIEKEEFMEHNDDNSAAHQERNVDGSVRKKSLRSHRSDVDAGGTTNNHVDSNGIGKVGKNCESQSSRNDGLNNHISRGSSQCSSPLSICVGPSVNNSIPGPTVSPKSSTLLQQVLSWQIVPDHLYCQLPVQPSLVYGAIHLARLFVKLPDLLYSTSMPDRKLKLVLRHLDMFLRYLEEHKDWFGEHIYIDNTCSS